MSELRVYFRAMVALLLITLGERVVFAVYHSELSADLSAGQLVTALFWGTRFDGALVSLLVFLCYFAAYLAYRLARAEFSSFLRYGTYIAAVTLVLLQGSDLLYFADSGRHLGYELRDAYTSGGELIASALNTYTGPALFQLALIVPALWLVRVLVQGEDGLVERAGIARLAPEGQLVAVAALTAILARGGVQGVPLEPLHAQELGNSHEAALALNGAYNALFSSVTPYSIKRVVKQAPTQKELRLVRDLYQPATTKALAPTATGYNVVVILLESWSGAFVSSYGYQHPTTPNFDRLRREGLTADAMIAGGNRTTEGMFATFCSAQNPLGNTVAQSQLQNYSYLCLPQVLRSHGYDTAFFQGTVSGTSGTGAFAQLLGFQGSFGKEHMDLSSVRYELNSWGVHDPDLYHFVLKKMRHMKRPFFIGVNTNSTHDSMLPKGVPPLLQNAGPHTGFINALHFADAALGKFVNQVQNMPDIGPTLFVLVGDHTGPNLSSPFYNYLIPFAILGPDIHPGKVPYAAAQRDITPTVLDLLGYPVPDRMMGQSLLRDYRYRFADFYAAGQLGWLQDGVLTMLPAKGDSPPRCYDYRADPWMNKPGECGSNGDLWAERARAFTRTAQQLLFEDRLSDFARLRNVK